MQKWLLLILVQLFVWQLNGQHKKKIYVYELDNIRGLYYQPNTIKPYTGTAFDKFPDGKKRLEIPIKDGKVHGKTKEWASTGKKVAEMNYVNGQPHGKEMQWYPLGKKKLEVNYINGKVEGIVTEWYKNEKKKSEGNYINGKEEGKHEWWHQNGQLDQIIFYKNGLAQGLVKNWFSNGKLRLESNFKDGKKDGLTTEWFENGKKFSEINYADNKENGMSYAWNKKGMLIKEEKFNQGSLLFSKNYLSGNIYSGDGYWQVFNEMNDFFRIKITGNSVHGRRSDEITYVVDGDLLQIFNQPSEQYFGESFSNIGAKELLEKYIQKESKYISNATNFPIETKTDFGKTPAGYDFVHWSFVSPSSQEEEQKPRTVQEEHYISFICGERILSLYGVVTNNDTPEEIKSMLQRIANSLILEKERIDLNALAKSFRKK